MTTSFTLADPDADETIAVRDDGIRFSATGRHRLGADIGDPVIVDSEETTVASIEKDCPRLSDRGALAGTAVRQNAGADVGESVAVSPVTPQKAESVTVRPTRSFSLTGDTDALSQALAGRYLTCGDRIEVCLFGGTVVVSLAIVDTVPSGPVVATDDTAIVISDPTPGEKPHPSVPQSSANAIGGLSEERSTLRRLVSGPLSDPDTYRTIGARTPAGILVYGPSGSGKTQLVRAVASEAALPVQEIEPLDCESRESLASILRDVEDVAPAILHITNLERAAPNPNENSGRRTQSALGWLLDQTRERPDLVVVGEASRADAVDPALRRGGRFDSELRVGLLGPDDRREVLDVHVAGVRLADSVDLDALAARTHGYTGADLEAVLVEAATRAADRLNTETKTNDQPEAAAELRREDIDAAVEAVGPTILREVRIERPSVSYRDIGGQKPALREVIRTVEWPLRYPELFERLSTDAPTGVLLYGPPGTGKTLLAKAVANSTDANFIAVEGPELMNRYVGESERGVREVFERARRSGPSIVFLDELDALAPGRRDTDTGAAERVVSQLLTELDGLSGRGEVAVLAATNRPESIDRALLRPGRIEKRVEVPLPDRPARREILAIHLADVPTANDVDLDALAAATAGYSGSDLAGIVREAALAGMEAYLTAAGDVETLDGLMIEQRHLREAIEHSHPSVDPADRHDSAQ